MAHGGRRLRARTRALAVALTAGLLAGCGAAGTGDTDAPPGSARAEWTQVHTGPLSARQEAVSAWTGREFLILGGRSDPRRHPRAGCAAP